MVIRHTASRTFARAILEGRRTVWHGNCGCDGSPGSSSNKL